VDRELGGDGGLREKTTLCQGGNEEIFAKTSVLLLFIFVNWDEADGEVMFVGYFLEPFYAPFFWLFVHGLTPFSRQ